MNDLIWVLAALAWTGFLLLTLVFFTGARKRNHTPAPGNEHRTATGLADPDSDRGPPAPVSRPRPAHHGPVPRSRLRRSWSSAGLWLLPLGSQRRSSPWKSFS